jgi:transposase-like protein
VNLRHFENKARQSWWLIHIEAWRRSGLSRAKYCRQQGLTTTTFGRWLNYLAGKEAARKEAEYQAELRRQQHREAEEKRRRRRSRFRFGVSTDMRSRALQAFWAMHVEAMNWSGMSVREYAAALHLSPTSLRKWRDRLDDGEVDIDWRAHLHPSARPVAGTSAKRTPSETGLTAPPSDDPSPRRQPLRRFFTDDQKRAIALETDQPGVSVSQVARKHGIVTGLLFRWRVQFGVAQRKGAKLAPVALTDDAPTILRLRDLVQPPNGMTAIDLPGGRRVFAPAGSDRHTVREHVIGEGAEP